jgi:hypothetical protein
MGAQGPSHLETWETTKLPQPPSTTCKLTAMPRGLVRYHHAGNFHFVTFSCFHRYPYLGTVFARDLFENALERTRQRYRFVVAEYVVMPEHVH